MFLENPLFTDFVLPFLVVFVVVFSVLQKSKILGDGKKQLDAILALSIGLIAILFPFAREFIINIMPYLAVGLAAILVFFILLGFVIGDVSSVPKWGKYIALVVVGIFVVAVVLYLTGLLGWIQGFLYSDLWETLFVLIIIIVVVAVAVRDEVTGDKKK